MTRSQSSAADVSAILYGEQLPRLSSAPPRLSSAGAEAVAIAKHAGLHLFPWQEFVLDLALGERADGKWSAFEVGLIVARQNGKGGVLEALELAHLFLFGSKTIIHSAHRLDTSMQAQTRLWSLISQTPDLLRQVVNGKANTGNGKEGITLRSGARIRFTTRVKDGGRGLSGDLVILDEAMDLPTSVMAALLPTMRARPNPQLWYVGSPIDQDKDVDGATLSEIRRRGIEGEDSLAFAEWSAGEWADYQAGRIDLDDRRCWAASNPSLGYLIDEEHMVKERRALRAVPRTFVIELLGIGDYPAEETEVHRVIELDTWEARADAASQIIDTPTLTLDMDPAQKKVAIGAAGTRADGKLHVEVIDHRDGTDWVVARVRDLVYDWDLEPAVVIDDRSPATALIPDLKAAGVAVYRTNTSELAQACGMFLAYTKTAALAHLAQPELDAAVQSAEPRDLGGQWAWQRKGNASITPLYAVTLAAWRHLTKPKPKPAPAAPQVEAVSASNTSPLAGLLTAGF